MELKYKAIACFLIGIFSLSGCTSTFDDLNTNPAVSYTHLTLPTN